MVGQVYQRVHNMTVSLSNVLLVVSLLEQKGIISPEELQAEQERLQEKKDAEENHGTTEAETEEEEGAGEGDSGLDHRDAPD